MEEQTQHYRQFIPRLIAQFSKDLKGGLEPFKNKDKIHILERLIPFSQALNDGQQNLRTLYENSFLWILRTYGKKAQQLNENNIPDYFFNGSIKFLPELKQADSPQEWIGFQLDEKAFDAYLTELVITLMHQREQLYLEIEPIEEPEPEEVRTNTLSAKQTALYYHYLNSGYKICLDKRQLAKQAHIVSGFNEDNLYKKILAPLGTETEFISETFRAVLRKDILIVRKIFETGKKDSLALKSIDRDLRAIEKADRGED